MIRMVLSDVDGTLLPFGQRQVSERTKDAIRMVGKRGVRFGLATGRDVVELMRIFGGEADLFANGILSNGKKIMVDGDCVRLTLLDRDALCRIERLLRGFGRTWLCLYPYETEEDNPVYCVRADREDALAVGTRFAFRPVLVDEVPDFEVIGATISCLGPQEVLDEIRRQGSAACPGLDFVQPAPHWCDILPKGVDKGSALPWLLEATGTGEDEVVVFGDAENDLTLLRAVTHSVAVAEATDAVRRVARHHVGRAEDDSVAEALIDLARGIDEGRLPSFLGES